MEENNETKAGHAPAQKVGGVRIAQKKNKDEKIVHNRDQSRAKTCTFTITQRHLYKQDSTEK